MIRSSRSSQRRSRPTEQGQAIVILALSVAVLLMLAAVVVDGGNAFVQQRGTQNAADSAALAGATVMVKHVGDPTDSQWNSGAVLDAINHSLGKNVADLGSADYVRYDFSVIGAVSSGGSIPADAGGVKVTTSRTFGTYLASIAGVNSMQAGAEATALAGVFQGICADNCAFLPVTFPVKVELCDGTNRSFDIGTDWVTVPLDTALADGSGRYESIIPLCSNGPGDVGWLDFGEIAAEQGISCGNNLSQWIWPSCPIALPVPDWYHAQTGNTNATDNDLSHYIGQVVMIPLFDGTCRDDPSPGTCPVGQEGNGSNFWYHIPKVAAFLLDYVDVQGGNNSACNSSPGQPYVGGNGSTGCLKGWFIDNVGSGNVGDSSGSGGTPTVLGVQLVH
jgi:hypothetical protein